MNYIIFDLEWNQPADERSTVQDPVYLNGEIIEIGALKVINGQAVQTFSQLVKPNNKISINK